MAGKDSSTKRRSDAPDESKVVALRQGASLAQLPAGMASLGDVMGAGASDAVEDRGTALIYIAQKGSPQVDKERPEYIEGLEVGMAFNPLTQHFWPETKEKGVPFLPCYFRKNWLEWVPRSEGGGFRGMHDWIDPKEIPQQFGAESVESRRDLFRIPSSGTDLVLTHHYFGIFPETLEPGIIPMSSTNLKASQQIQALINGAKISHEGGIKTAPAFLLPWRMRSVYSTNDKGTWYRWAPQRTGSLLDQSTWTDQVYGPEVLELCAELARSARRGEVRMAQPMSSAEVQSEDEVPI
jgi:hypothetical protein